MQTATSINFSHKMVERAKILIGDRTFSLTTPQTDQPPDRPLTESIQRFGLICPPILKETEEGSYQIVSGRRRLAAAEMLNDPPEQIGCLVLPTTAPPEQILALALEETTLRRPASPIEQAVFMDKILKYISEEELERDFSSALDLCRRERPGTIMKLLRLEDHLIAALHQQRLTPEAAFRLLARSPAERLRLHEIIEQLSLSRSNQKKLLDCCADLSRRNQWTIEEIFDQETSREILAHPTANPPQKSAGLLAWLAALQQPRLTAARRDFKRFVSNLKLPAGVSIDHARSFERDSITLKIEFNNSDEFNDCWPKLNRTLPNPPKKVK